MGAAALPMMLPQMLAMMGGAGGGGQPAAGGAAASAAPSPFSGLFGAGKDQSQLPNAAMAQVPEKNPAFHASEDEAKLIPGMQGGLFGGTSKPPAAPAGITKTETVQGVPMEGGVMLSDPAQAKRTPNGMPTTLDPTSMAATATAQSKTLFDDAMPAQAQPHSPLTSSPLANAGATPKPAGGELGATSNPASGLFGGIQDKLRQSGTNPLFQVGMGLMSSGHDGSNPYGMINKNLQAIPGMQHAANTDTRAQSKEGREAEDMRNQQQLAALLAAIGQQHATPETAGTSRVARGAAKVVR